MASIFKIQLSYNDLKYYLAIYHADMSGQKHPQTYGYNSTPKLQNLLQKGTSLSERAGQGIC